MKDQVRIANQIFFNVTNILLLSKHDSRRGWIQVWFNGGKDVEELFFKSHEIAEMEFNKI